MKPLRILIVDDSTSSRLMIKASLDQIPERQIDQAENGEVAVNKFALNNYDLVLMDIHMPSVDGYEATRRIRQWERENRRQSTPIIALTALDHAQASVRTRGVGCNACVPKPVKKPLLMEAIRAVTGLDFTKPVAPVGAPDAKSAAAKPAPAQGPSDIDKLRPAFVAEKRREADIALLALSKNDFRTVRMLALRLKGEGANFGFNELTQIGAELAEAANKMDPQTSRKLAQQLSAHLVKLHESYR
ncbi:MAG TPA: response regulator [Candidatus Binataceae bacterium]|nr:response regulator [Candidatus Binataceae bacterium]